MRIGDWGSDGCSSDLRSHQSPRDTKELEDHIRALRRYARALIGNRSDADDLVQETLRRALTYLSDGREIRNPRAYLLTMLHHVRVDHVKRLIRNNRSEEHTSELQSLMRISYAVFCLKKKT